MILKPYSEVKQRFNNLTEQSQLQWAKMEPAQMLAYCKEALKYHFSDTAYPRIFGKINRLNDEIKII